MPVRPASDAARGPMRAATSSQAPRSSPPPTDEHGKAARGEGLSDLGEAFRRPALRGTVPGPGPEQRERGEVLRRRAPHRGPGPVEILVAHAQARRRLEAPRDPEPRPEREILLGQMPVPSRRPAQGARQERRAALASIADAPAGPGAPGEPGARERRRQHQRGVRSPGPRARRHRPVEHAIAGPRQQRVREPVADQQGVESGRTDAPELRARVRRAQREEQRARHEHVAQPVRQADEDALRGAAAGASALSRPARRARPRLPGGREAREVRLVERDAAQRRRAALLDLGLERARRRPRAARRNRACPRPRSAAPGRRSTSRRRCSPRGTPSPARKRSACTSSSSAGRRAASRSSGMDSFFAIQPPHAHHRALLHVLRPDLEAHRDAAQLVLVVLPARRVLLAGVHLQPDAVPQRLLHLPDEGQHRGALLRLAPDRHHHGLHRGDARRQLQAVVVAVGQDHAADQPRGDAPRGLPDVLARALLVLVGDVEDLREVLAEVVRGAGLQRVAVLHQRLDRVRHLGAGELLRIALRPRVDRHGQLGLDEVPVDLEHPQHLGLALLGGGVRGVALLPEELRGAQEGPGDHLPAHHVRPLVDEHRQVPVRLDPLRVHRADDRLARGADREPLLELLVPAVGDPGDLRERSPRRARPPSAAGSPG